MADEPLDPSEPSKSRSDRNERMQGTGVGSGIRHFGWSAKQTSDCQSETGPMSVRRGLVRI